MGIHLWLGLFSGGLQKCLDIKSNAAASTKSKSTSSLSSIKPGKAEKITLSLRTKVSEFIAQGRRRGGGEGKFHILDPIPYTQ